MTAYQAERFYNPVTWYMHTELRTGEGQLIEFPTEYPQDGAGISIAFWGGHPVIAHPDHRAYIYKGNRWEIISADVERPLTFSGELKEDGDRERTFKPYDK